MAQKVDNSWVLFNKPLRYDDVLQPALNPTSFLFPSTSNTLALSTCHFHMFSKSLPIFPHIGPAIFHLLLILPLPEASPLWTLRQTSWPANFSCLKNTYGPWITDTPLSDPHSISCFDFLLTKLKGCLLSESANKISL